MPVKRQVDRLLELAAKLGDAPVYTFDMALAVLERLLSERQKDKAVAARVSNDPATRREL